MSNLWSEFADTTFYAILLGYFIGSIPFGLLLTKAAGLGDVRSIGSGNIGATNVLRTGNKGLAAATLILDLIKGFVPVYIAWRWFWQDVGWTALFAVIGHCFPVWLKFKGGKGVATNAGVAFGLAWPIGVVYGVVWLAMLAITRFSSVAGMTAVVAAAAYSVYLVDSPPARSMSVIALLILWLHRDNIRRLLKGEEPKVGRKT